MENYISDSLRELKTLDLQLKNISSRLEGVQELLEDEDGCRAYRMKNGHSSNSYKTSTVEKVTTRKGKLLQAQAKLESISILVTVKMEDILGELQYRIRDKEWNLLKDVFVNQYSPVKLSSKYGQQWERRLSKVFEEHEGR